jgi:hypothetical protein
MDNTDDWNNNGANNNNNNAAGEHHNNAALHPKICCSLIKIEPRFSLLRRCTASKQQWNEH